MNYNNCNNGYSYSTLSLKQMQMQNLSVNTAQQHHTLHLYRTCKIMYYTCTIIYYICTIMYYTCTIMYYTCTVMYYTCTIMYYTCAIIHYIRTIMPQNVFVNTAQKQSSSHTASLLHMYNHVLHMYNHVLLMYNHVLHMYNHTLHTYNHASKRVCEHCTETILITHYITTAHAQSCTTHVQSCTTHVRTIMYYTCTIIHYIRTIMPQNVFVNTAQKQSSSHTASLLHMHNHVLHMYNHVLLMYNHVLHMYNHTLHTYNHASKRVCEHCTETILITHCITTAHTNIQMCLANSTRINPHTCRNINVQKNTRENTADSTFCCVYMYAQYLHK